MKTYCVIPHFLINDELWELAKVAVASLKKECFIVNVDDGSPTHSDDLKEISDQYIRNKINSGFAITCNNGFRWIMENEPDDCYIVCANNDIEVFDGWLWALKDPFDKYENVAITGIVSNRERVIDGVPIEKWHRNRVAEGGLLDGWMQSGGLWLTKKSVLEKIGLFDEQFLRGGYEDVDIFLRARDTFGMKIIMSEKAMFWHKEGATRWNTQSVGAVNNFGLESKSIEGENLKRFIHKWGYNPHRQQIWKTIYLET